MKRCSKCKEYKGVHDFYTDRRTPDGLKCQCKKCHSETNILTRNQEKHRESRKLSMRRAVKANPEKYREQWRNRLRIRDQKVTARILLNRAVRNGRIHRPNCCSECHCVRKLTGRHVNYNDPYNVEWLCYECHAKRHIKCEADGDP